MDWQEFVTAESSSPWRLVAHPAIRHGEPIGSSLPAKLPSQQTPIHLAIGPEGGLAVEEVELAVSGGWQLIDLGTRILRTETAALVLATWATHRILESTGQ
jgi:16S rRNA (uracil1498-N3)-methyltransferase